MKEEKFPHTRKLLHWQRQGVGGGSFRAMEENAATGAAEGKVERFLHRGLVQPALTSLRGLSAHPPGRAGAGS